MKTERKFVGSIAVIQLTGKLNFEVTADLRDTLRETISQKPSKIVINLSGLNHIDSSGMGLLIATRNTGDKNEISLALCEAPSVIKKALSQTNLLSYFNIFETESEALAS